MNQTFHIHTEIKDQLEQIRNNEVRRYLRKNNLENSEMLEACTQKFLERILAFTLEQTAQQPVDKQQEYIGQLVQIFNRHERFELQKND